jgi:phage terminase large subunit-like protein
LRGKQHYKIWADELGSWRYPEAWEQAMLGLRLGNKPQAIVTTTPKPTKLMLGLIEDKRNIVTVGSTYENRANLAPGFFDYVISKYEGTRLGRQELNAELLTDSPGALWKRDQIDASRVIRAPETMSRVVVGVDPTASSTGDEAGIITVGHIDKDYYTLSDDSIQGSPHAWASAAVTAYYRHRADCIVAEKNNGGEMVEAVIKQVDDNVNVKLVWASHGKATRAEPIAAIAEQGHDHHVGTFAMLEDELCMWVPGDASPNRLDAKVWAMTELSDTDNWLVS